MPIDDSPDETTSSSPGETTDSSSGEITDSSVDEATNQGDTGAGEPVGSEGGGLGESGHAGEQLDAGAEHDQAKAGFESQEGELAGAGGDAPEADGDVQPVTGGSPSGERTKQGDTGAGEPVGSEGGGLGESGHAGEQLNPGAEHDQAKAGFESQQGELAGDGPADGDVQPAAGATSSAETTEQVDTGTEAPADSAGEPGHEAEQGDAGASGGDKPDPDPNGGLSTGTEDAPNYPEEKKDAATKPVESEHVTHQVASLSDKTTKFEQQLADTADAMSGIDGTSQGQPADPPAQVEETQHRPDGVLGGLTLLFAGGLTAGAVAFRKLVDWVRSR